MTALKDNQCEMHRVPFVKMQGLGNDYIYLWGTFDDPAALSRRLSDRHFGIGGDGIIVISPSETADFRMRIFNADGSEALMCGNGIRCVGKYVYDRKLTRKTELSVETASGIRHLTLHPENGVVDAVTVDMGRGEVLGERTLRVCGTEITVTEVSVGNPHAVTFVQDAEQAPLAAVGAAISAHEAFPDGINAEFVSVSGRNTLRMRVWERGSGITLACGTGACACAAAASAKHLCDASAPVTVITDGGKLTVRISDTGELFMTGPAVTVFEGEFLL